MICRNKTVYLVSQKKKQTFGNLTDSGCICEGLFLRDTSYLNAIKALHTKLN